MNYLAQFQPFTTKSELNEAVSAHSHRHQGQFNDTDRHVLTMLSRYAVKYPGAAHLKLATIAQTIKKSDRTVRRSLEKLEQLGVIERQTFLRVKTGGQGANLYIFKPYNQLEEATVATEVCEVKEFEVVNQDVEQIPITYYTRFKNLVQSYTGKDNADFDSRLYGIYRAHSIRLMKFTIHADKSALFETLALQAVNILFQKTKKKNIHNLCGYYNGILRGLIDKALFSDSFMDYDVPVVMKLPV